MLREVTVFKCCLTPCCRECEKLDGWMERRFLNFYFIIFLREENENCSASLKKFRAVIVLSDQKNKSKNTKKKTKKPKRIDGRSRSKGLTSSSLHPSPSGQKSVFTNKKQTRKCLGCILTVNSSISAVSS